MRIAVTGVGGFVGPWLVAELTDAGHEVVGERPGPDVTDQPALREWLGRARPDAVAHLAAVSLPRAADADPARAFAVNVGGTINLCEAARALPVRPVVLVSSSADVYGRPDPEHLPLVEDAPLRPLTPYALSKAAQEAVTIAAGARHGLHVTAVRAFNHTGPGQSRDFAVPALAARVAEVARGRSDVIRTGNLDVARDFLDVRDVVRAYRLLLEGMRAGSVPPGTVVNVCSGTSVTIRRVVEILCRLAGAEAPVIVDPELARPGEAPEIRGDASRLAGLVGWQPRHGLDETLSAVLAAAGA